jgi:hypothetical protein
MAGDAYAQGRGGRDKGGADPRIVEVTNEGWVRWKRGQGLIAGTIPDEVGLFAPEWRRGWRAALLRRLWSPAPGAPTVHGLPVDAAAAGTVLFLVGLRVLGPSLRGTTAVTVPLTLAVLVTMGVPHLGRHLTRRRVRIITGQGWPAQRVHQVLDAHRTLAAAPCDCGALVLEMLGAEEAGYRLLWTAAGQARVGGREGRALVATVRTATYLAARSRSSVAQCDVARHGALANSAGVFRF